MTTECVPLSFSFFVVAFCVCVCVCVCVLSVLILYSEKRREKMPILFNNLLEFVDADYEIRKTRVDI